MTFSIVAFDPKTKDLGVAVESKFPAVGAVVPWARAGVGAIATQSYANTTFGPRGLSLLKRGLPPKHVLRQLTAKDKDRAMRQVGVVDARGRAAAYTGKACQPWAGHIVGKSHTCQGNILAGEAVVEAMARAFDGTKGDLPEKLIAALVAGQDAGGDRRGQQSAALLVVRAKGGYGGYNDRWIDLRVDDHPRPIEELSRIFRMWDATMLTREDSRDVIEISPEVADFLRRFLAASGFYKGPRTGEWDASAQNALDAWMRQENLEQKVRADGTLWPSIWGYLKDKAGSG